MEAKNTVMSWERIRIIMVRSNEAGLSGEARVEKYCEAQAEISFKMGYNQALKDYNIDTTTSGMV